MPSTRACSAASFESRSGAKPPSSPTAVASPCACSVFFNAWYTSTPARSPSENDENPTGTTMNSWKSTLLSACAPPFSRFIIGTGSTCDASPPRERAPPTRPPPPPPPATTHPHSVHPPLPRGRLRITQVDAQNRFRPEPRLVRRAVELDHPPVE